MAEFDVIGVEYRANTEAYEQGLKDAIAANQKLAATSGKTADQMQADLNQTAQATQKLKAETSELINEQDKLESGSKSLKAQLRQLKNELALMSEEDPGFLKMAVEAAKLEDKIGDVQARVRALASDEKLFDALAQGATGLAGAFSAAEGAAALLGKENQDLQKALLRVNAAMALANGLQQVAQTLNKDSAFRVVALAKAQQLYNIIVGQSTGALKVFRLALASTGIGLFVIALGALIANWDKIKGTLGFGVNPEMERLAIATKAAADASRQALEDFDLEERALRALGKAEGDLIVLRRKKLNDTILNSTLELQAQQAILADMEKIRYASRRGYSAPKYSEEEKKAQRELVKTMQNNITELNIKVLEGFQKQIDIEKEAHKKEQEEQKKANEKKITDEKEYQQLVINAMKEGHEKQLAQEEFNYQQERQKFKDQKAALEELEKQHQEKMQTILSDALTDRQNKIFEAGGLELKAELDKKEDKKKAEEDFMLQFLEGEERQAAVDQRGADERKQIAQELADTRVAIEQQAFTSISALGDIIIKDEERRAKFQKSLAVFQIAVNTAEAIAKGIAASSGVPFPGNLIAIATTVATVLANIAQAKSLLSVDPPAYAEGVIDLKGPGSGTSDSIAARLSRGESVMTARETKEYKDELYAIRRGEFQNLITTKYVLPQLKAAHEARTTGERMAAGMALNFDDSEINYNLRKIASRKDILWLGDKIESSNSWLKKQERKASKFKRN